MYVLYVFTSTRLRNFPYSTVGRQLRQGGPVLLFGSSGAIVEAYNDVALRRCPITSAEAQAMIAEVKGARLLQGFRGRPAADLDALTDTLVRVSDLAMHLEGQLAELDINPLMVLPSGRGVKQQTPSSCFVGHSAQNSSSSGAFSLITARVSCSPRLESRSIHSAGIAKKSVG